MSAGLTPVLEGVCVCRFNSSPGGGPVSAGLTPVLEGVLQSCSVSVGLTPVLEGVLCLQV